MWTSEVGAIDAWAITLGPNRNQQAPITLFGCPPYDPMRVASGGERLTAVIVAVPKEISPWPTARAHEM
jgi:hypothetical protein